MEGFISRVNALKSGTSTNAFAKRLEIPQKTLDQMLKGQRKPSVQIVLAICKKCAVSADWLLGLK